MDACKLVEQEKNWTKRVKSQPLLYTCDHAHLVISKLLALTHVETMPPTQRIFVRWKQRMNIRLPKIDIRFSPNNNYYVHCRFVL